MKGFHLLSLIYGFVILIRNLLFNIGVLKVRRLPVTVISVGNITSGGTGKTPLVIYLGEWLKARGVRFGVLSRGYGRKSLRPFFLESSKEASASDIGDEPKMIGEKLGCRLGIGGDRVRIGGLLLEKYGRMPLLLDDGFSHRYIHRDLDLVTINSEDPFSHGLLPYGLRREGLRGLRRAHAFIIIRSGLAPGDDSPILDRLETLKAAGPVFTAYRRAECVVAPDGSECPLSAVQGRPFYLFSGIASGDQFVKFAAETGIMVAGHVTYPDHFRFDRAEIDQIRRNAGTAPLLTTEKDYWRLEKLNCGAHVLRIRLVFDEEADFSLFLEKAIPLSH